MTEADIHRVLNTHDNLVSAASVAVAMSAMPASKLNG